MLDGKLILVLSFLCVTPLTIWELATCEDRKCKLKCFRGAAKLEIFFFSRLPSCLWVNETKRLEIAVLSFVVLFMVMECGIF